MKFISINDGTVEHDGAVFAPLEERYHSARSCGDECERLLKQLRANKAKFADNQYWRTRACKNGAEPARLERLRVALAVTSNNIVLQEASHCLREELSSLSLFTDSLQRRVDFIELASTRYAGMNNWVLAKALHDRLFALETKLRSALEKDPTEGLGRLGLGKAFVVQKQALAKDQSKDETEEEIVEEPDLDLSLAYVVKSSGTWYLDQPEARALDAEVKKSQALLAQVRKLRRETEQAAKTFDARQYYKRMEEAKTDEVNLRLRKELAWARCEVASSEIALALLAEPLKLANVALCEKLNAFTAANSKYIGRCGERSLSVIMNNCVFVRVLSKALKAHSFWCGDIIRQTDSIRGLREEVFEGKVPFLADLNDRTAV